MLACAMGATLTIRNLDEDVKQRLRLRAAVHQRSMEAEARAILAESLVGSGAPSEEDPDGIARRRRRIEAVMGSWKDRYEGKSTDEVMSELRGDE